MKTSNVSRDVLGMPFSAGDLRTKAPKDIIVIFEELLSVVNMYGYHHG